LFIPDPDAYFLPSRIQGSKMLPIPHPDPQHCSGLCSGSGLNWISGFGSGQAKVVPLIKEKLRNFMSELFKFVSSKWKKTCLFNPCLDPDLTRNYYSLDLDTVNLDSNDCLREGTLLSFTESSDCNLLKIQIYFPSTKRFRSLWRY
jgi:hypothetical protein